MGRSASPHRALLRIAITLTLTTAVLPMDWAASEPLKPSASATQLLKEAEQNERLIAQAQQSEYRLEDMYGTEVSFSQDRGASPGYAQPAPSYDNEAEHQRQEQAKAAFRSAKTGDSLLAIEGVSTGTCMAYRNGKWVAEPCKTAVPEDGPLPPPNNVLSQLTDQYRAKRNHAVNTLRNPYYWIKPDNRMATEILAYIAERVPSERSVQSFEELYAAVGELEAFFDGYAMAYGKAADRLVWINEQLDDDQKRLHQLEAETLSIKDDLARAANEFKGLKEKFDGATAQLDKTLKFLVWMDQDSKAIALRLHQGFKKPVPKTLSERAPYYDYADLWFHYGASLPTPVARWASPVVPSWAMGRRPIPAGLPKYLDPVTLSPQRVTAETIQDKLSVSGVATLAQMVEKYVSYGTLYSPDTPTQAQRVWDLTLSTYRDNRRIAQHLDITQGQIEEARKALPVLERGVPRAIKAGLYRMVRWGFWRYLDSVSGVVLAGDVQNPQLDPRMAVRFLKVQTDVVKFAEEDLKFFGEGVHAVAHNDPAEIERIREAMHTSLCNFAAKVGTHIFPLPRPFTNSPLIDLFPPNPACSVDEQRQEE